MAAYTVDESLVRQPGEEEEFSARFVENQVGSGLCQSAEYLRQFVKVPLEMDFRVTIFNDGEFAHIWVRPDDLREHRAQQGKERDQRSMRQFKQSLPVLVIGSIIFSLLIGGANALRFFIWGSVLSLDANIVAAFLWGAGPTLLICSLCLIFITLNKGRAEGVR